MSGLPVFGEAYFEQVYRDYDRQNPPRKLAFYTQVVEHYAASGRTRTILDLGCAFGKFLGQLGDEWQKCGIDLSEHAIRNANQLVPQAKLAVASCARAPFARTYDAIVSFDVLEHVEDLDEVGKYVAASLEPEGIFVFVVPVYDGPLGPMVHLLDRDPTHIHKKPRAFWLSWADSRFDVQAWCGIFRYLLPGGTYLHFPSQIFRQMAPAILVVARSRTFPR